MKGRLNNKTERAQDLTSVKLGRQEDDPANFTFGSDNKF